MDHLVLHQRERDYRVKSEGAVTATAGVSAQSGRQGHTANVPATTRPLTDAGAVRHRSIVSPGKGLPSINTAPGNRETLATPSSPHPVTVALSGVAGVGGGGGGGVIGGGRFGLGADGGVGGCGGVFLCVGVGSSWLWCWW